MKFANISLIIILLAIFSFSCGKKSSSNRDIPKKEIEKKDTNTQILLNDKEEAKVLKVVDLKFDNLRDLPIENRCKGLKDFVVGYIKQYSDSVSIKEIKCETIHPRAPYGIYNLRFSLTKSDGEISFILSVKGLNLASPEYTLKVNKDEKYYFYNSFETITFDSYLSSFDQNLGHFHKSIYSYLGLKALNSTIYGHDFFDFNYTLRELSKEGFLGIYVKREGGKKVEIPIKIELIPTSEDKFYEGRVSFIAADDSFFQDAQTLLGCHNLKCLQDSNILYEVEENALTIERIGRGQGWFIGWVIEEYPHID